MNRKKARRYLQSRDFYADTEGVNEFLEAWLAIRAEYPDIPESNLLAGMDLDHNSQWAFFPEDTVDALDPDMGRAMELAALESLQDRAYEDWKKFTDALNPEKGWKGDR